MPTNIVSYSGEKRREKNTRFQSDGESEEQTCRLSLQGDFSSVAIFIVTATTKPDVLNC